MTAFATALRALPWFAVVGLAAPISYAEPSADDKALAQSLFRDGRALLVQGKTTEACAKLAESDRLDPEIGTHLNLAICHETLGKTASAWVEFGEVADRAGRTHDAERADYARSHADALEPKLSRVRLHVENPSADMTIKLDGDAVGRAAWGTAVPLDPGHHAVLAEAPGRLPRVQAIEVPPGPATLDVDVAPLDEAAAHGATLLPPPPESPPSRGSALRTAGFVVGGVGLAGIVAGSIFGALTFAQNGVANDHCTFPGSTCDSTGVSAGQQASAFATASTATFIAGAICLAAGVTLVLIGRPGKPPAAQVGAGPGALLLQGSF